MDEYYAKQLKQIRELGYRVTPQRQLILDSLVKYGGHAAALEIYEIISQKSPSINKATVYRVLEFFCEVQLATKTEMNGRTYYEVVGEEPHHHLICTTCGSIELLSDHHFDSLINHLAEEHDFIADLNHLAVSGTCRNCQ